MPTSRLCTETMQSRDSIRHEYNLLCMYLYVLVCTCMYLCRVCRAWNKLHRASCQGVHLSEDGYSGLDTTEQLCDT